MVFRGGDVPSSRAYAESFLKGLALITRYA